VSDRRRDFAYRRLCALAREAGGSIELSRNNSGWGLQVTVAATLLNDGARGAAFLFPSIAELDTHAAHLLPWLSRVSSLSDPTP
jgi:hypothetical protein